jgi:hypothetical protein
MVYLDSPYTIDFMLVNRIGTFFTLLGLGMIGIFILSDMARTPSCNYLVIGAVFLGLGIFLWLRDPAPPPQETGRFRILRKTEKKQGKK